MEKLLFVACVRALSLERGMGMVESWKCLL